MRRRVRSPPDSPSRFSRAANSLFKSASMRSSSTSVSPSCESSDTAPSLRTSPSSGTSSPANTRRSVLFPAPFSPTRPTRSPSYSSNRSISSTRRSA